MTSDLYGHAATLEIPVSLSVQCTLRNPQINGLSCSCAGAVMEASGMVGAGHDQLLVWPEVHRCESCGGARFDKGG